MMSLSIYGSDGKCHYSAQYNKLNQFETELPVHHLEQGVYHVVMVTDNEKRTGKLVLVK